MKEIIIIGAGGNSKVIIDILLEMMKTGEDIQIRGILDDDTTKEMFQGFPVIGISSCISELLKNKQIWFVNGIGKNEIRKAMYKEYGAEVQYYTAIHPSVIIGSDVSIDAGSVVMPGVIINSGTKIGKQVIVNTGTILEHDNVIEDFVHVASGTVTAGNVRVGEGSMLGTGTRVIQGINIGSNVLIGAGAAVIRDINNNCIAVGVPAKVIKSY